MLDAWGQRYVFSAQRGVVAQICNLPYRRFLIGRASDSSSVPHLLTCPPEALRQVDVPQNAILRYSRLQICATPKHTDSVPPGESLATFA